MRRNTSNVDNLSDKPKSNRPTDRPLTQQRLIAFRPTYSAGTVLPLFFIVGIIFVPIGISVLWVSQNVHEKVIDYTDCTNKDNKACKDEIMNQNATDRDCSCTAKFNIAEDWEGDVFMYYGLTNFYQNHRRYVGSKNDDQLLGKVDDEPAEEDCSPFYKDDNGITFYPCGAIANSLFSDVVLLRYTNRRVPLLRTGIAWESDKEFKFKNPPNTGTVEDLKSKFEGYAKPKHWKRNLWELDEETPNNTNNGLANEDLIVWMRTAALPNFRKIYRKIDHVKAGQDIGANFDQGIPQGSYELEIEYNFDVASFSGRKEIVLATKSLLGGNSPFLGIAYIVVGSICLLLGLLFLLVYCKYGKNWKEGANEMYPMSEMKNK